MTQNNPANSLIDNFGRKVTYLRLSVTDRCDFRCLYCMDDKMTFLPRADVLTLEELAQVGKTFVELGVTKIRITGGEPLIRRGVMQLFEQLGALPGLDELCLTTNASHLREYARPLRNAGVDRINVSLDSLIPERFRAMTRHGDLAQVLDGISAAQEAGFERIKLNTVLMQNQNADELESLVQFALNNSLDISFIEEMPLGAVSSHDRAAEFVSSEQLRQRLRQQFRLVPATTTTGGPSRYWQVPGSASRIGFISPHSENFCASCNRVRVTAAGRLLLCLGNEHSIDLRAILREFPDDDERLRQAIAESMGMKPEKHHFDLNDAPQILRFMNATGG